MGVLRGSGNRCKGHNLDECLRKEMAMPSYENRYDAAHEKYFAENPHILDRQMDAVSSKVIEACGITVEEYRQQQRYELFAKAARAHGLELDEFVIHLVAESPEQAHEWRITSHRQTADSLGIPWPDFNAMNRIEE
jgi:uncharacterized protein with von Willebrand factor type A (vWA) domain